MEKEIDIKNKLIGCEFMANVRVPAAVKRMYERVFVCMRCNSKMRTDALRIKSGKVKCRKCGYKHLRPKKKERKI
jgi:large subunit ribosomal protein L40e